VATPESVVADLARKWDDGGPGVATGTGELTATAVDVMRAAVAGAGGSSVGATSAEVT
jgi:hypothetical protein